MKYKKLVLFVFLPILIIAVAVIFLILNRKKTELTNQEIINKIVIQNNIVQSPINKEVEKLITDAPNLKEDEIVKKLVTEFKEKYTSITYNQDFRRAFKKLYDTNPKIIEVFEKTLLDPSYAKTLSGEDQAYARIFAIKALADLTYYGINGPVIKVANELSAKFEKSKTIEKGEAADLREIISSYTALQHPQYLENNFPKYFQDIGYSTDLKNKQLIDIYSESIYGSLSTKFGDKRGKDFFITYFVNKAKK